MPSWAEPPGRGALLAVAALVGAVSLAAGCTTGAEPSPRGTFAVPTASPVTCLEHQEEPPGIDYTGGEDADTAAVFELLRYWAAHGDLPYCDGQGATDVDQQWRDLVEQLGARRPPDPTGTDGAPIAPTPAPTGPRPTST